MPRRRLWIATERNDLMTGLVEQVTQPRANQPCAARNQDAHGRIPHPNFPLRIIMP
jgi:hypothetical protein